MGAAIAPILDLPPFRALDGKLDERDFHESTVFLKNDPDAIHRRARQAMIALHMLLLAAFAFAARRVSGDAIALGALLFLTIDPTVAAHKSDPARIQKQLEEAVALNPRAYPMYVSLGNHFAKYGRRDQAIRGFAAARHSLVACDPFGAVVDAHIARLRSELPQRVPKLTNPWAE